MTILLISGSKIAMNVISIYRINKCNYNAIDVCCKCHLIPFLLLYWTFIKAKKKKKSEVDFNGKLGAYSLHSES